MQLTAKYPHIAKLLQSGAVTFYSVRVRVGSGAYTPLDDQDTPAKGLAVIWLRNLATKYRQMGYSVEFAESGWFFAKKDGERTVSEVVWEVNS